MDEGAREQLVIVKRGQILGFGALTLMLITIVTLAAIGQSWVAGTVATTGLAVVVGIFVTGRHKVASEEHNLVGPYTSAAPPAARCNPAPD